MKLIWKLLGKHVSKLQLAGFFITNLVGVAIILTAVQLYRDVKPAIDAPDSFLARDYMILSRQVEGVSVGKSSFSAEEISDIAAQEFTADLGEFTPARYTVIGGISIAGISMSTYMFFESVPDKFLDVGSDDWKFEEGDRTIPIIIPKNYLNLYNFGFASTQGLPQVSEEMISRIPLEVELRGDGRRESFRGRVVAFSNRLNTILVPHSFIEWSNSQFADTPQVAPSRIIIEVSNPADRQLHAYLKEHGYEIEGDPNAGRANYFLRMITGVVAGVGILITALSFFILMLSIFLLLQKNTKKLEDLLLAGYTPAQVSRPYQMLTLWLNTGVLVCTIPIILWVRARYTPLVAEFAGGIHSASLWGTVLAGLGIMLVITLVNAVAIRRKVNSLWMHR